MPQKNFNSSKSNTSGIDQSDDDGGDSGGAAIGTTGHVDHGKSVLDDEEAAIAQAQADLEPAETGPRDEAGGAAGGTVNEGGGDGGGEPGGTARIILDDDWNETPTSSIEQPGADQPSVERPDAERPDDQPDGGGGGDEQPDAERPDAELAGGARTISTIGHVDHGKSVLDPAGEPAETGPRDEAGGDDGGGGDDIQGSGDEEIAHTPQQDVPEGDAEPQFQKNYNSSKSNTSSFRERDGGGEPLDQQTEVRMPDSGGGDDIQGSGDPLKGLNVTKGQRHGVGGGGGDDDTPQRAENYNSSRSNTATSIEDDGGGGEGGARDAATFKWSRDNGSVVGDAPSDDDEGPSTLLNTSEDDALEPSEVAPDLEGDIDIPEAEEIEVGGDLDV